MINYLQLIPILVGVCMGEMVMDSPSDAGESMTLALQKNSPSRTFHWLASLLMLVIIPSYTSAFALSGRIKISLFSQCVSCGYALLEALFLRFEDPTGHENRTSRGTAWVLLFIYIGTILNGWFSLKLTKLSISYKVLSCITPLLGFIKAAMNVVALLGFCYDDHTGQCNAHGIMGMSFIIYGLFMLIMLVIPWLRNNKGPFSQEFYDSTVITIWGIINTFTEHRPWEPWSHGDYQHTAMGILFWGCGALGMALSWKRRRSFLPALTLVFTGWAMAEHVQELITSTKVHGFFGLVLMFGGLARILEISFLLDDRDSPVDDKVRSFQYIPSLALILSGLLFMGANEEQIRLVIDLGADHSSYVMLIIAAACITHLWLFSILVLYLRLTGSTIDKYQSLSNPGEIELDDFHLDESVN